MKKSNLFFTGFIIFLFFVASCAKNQSTDVTQEFKKMCQESGYEWMLMKPTQNGKFIKDAQECMGCMVGIEHICDMEKFTEYLPVK